MAAAYEAPRGAEHVSARRSRGRVLWTTIAATLFAVGVVLFPLAGRVAAAADAGRAPHGAAPRAGGGAHADERAAQGWPRREGARRARAARQGPRPPSEPGPRADADLTAIPIGKGLPVRVNVGVFFLELAAFDDTKGEWEATVDVRLRWNDPRLAYDKKQTLRGYREFLGKAAEAELEDLDADDRRQEPHRGGRVHRSPAAHLPDRHRQRRSRARRASTRATSTRSPSRSTARSSA